VPDIFINIGVDAPSSAAWVSALCRSRCNVNGPPSTSGARPARRPAAPELHPPSTAVPYRGELQRLSAAGLMPRSRVDDAGALRAVGIDVEAVRQRLVTAFGAEAVGAAIWRASRRPWWRGGGRRRTPLCGPPFFAKRAMYLASCYAESRDAAAVTPEHLLYGVLRDLDDPYGTPLGRRRRKHLAQLGWAIGPVNPAGALLQAHDIDPVRLRSELDRTP
jgi:ClpA/ClpB-like protein